jgi:hypothetical protein
MHLFGGWGVLSLAVGALILLYLLVEKILGHDIADRPLLMLGLILFMAGLQLLALGILAEMHMRTYYESQDKKPYRIRRIHEAQS